jgi:large subunit ribosomal protein L25
MEETVLFAKPRTVTGKQVRALRRQGLLPAVIYGRHIEPMAISLDARETGRILPGLSRSSLVVVDVEGERHTTLVRERQRHPVSGFLVHVDFNAISMTEKLRTTVALVLRGDAPAIKNFDGVLVSGTEKVEVECFPVDLPSNIVIDLGVLEKIGDGIYVRDIVPPDRVEILTERDEMVALITAPAVEVEEVVVAPVEVVAGEPEVIEKGKKEEEVEE